MKPRTWRSKNTIHLLTCLTVLAACSRYQATPPAPNVATNSTQAPQKIEESFSIPPASAETLPPTPATPKDSSLIRLTKSSLGKAFLMTTVITPATHAPILEHLQPKVVSFEMAGGRLALMEVDTLALYSEQSSTRLLQTFEIVTEEDDAISFRWNLGLSALPLTESMGASDLPGSLDSMSSPVEHALHAQDSFVRKSSFIDNQLNIEQISRLSLSHIPLDLGSVLSGDGVSLDQQDMSVLVQTRLEPYALNPRFKPQHIALTSGVGYFETPHRDTDSEEMSSYALKWDLQAGPLTFALTSNTPEDMIPAIREGLLYWNRVAGQEILRVETGADPHEFPKKRRILVHWVDWKNGGFARASAQADPLTGELLYANIYLPSAFAESARKTIRRNLPPKTSKKTSATLTLSGFARAELCHLDAALDTPEKLPEQAAQDYVRLVVAHEAGHTLGLRHNFAGSLASKVTAIAQRSLWRKYLNGENVEALTSSTVMDYLPSADNLLLSRALLTQTLDYDRLALTRGGYTRSDLKAPSSHPLFCTDSQARNTHPVLGCEIFDSGSSPMESYALQLSTQKTLLAGTIADLVLPDKGDPQDILSAENMEKLKPERLAAVVSDSAKQGKKFMTPEAQVLSVERSLQGRSWRNEKKYLKNTDAALNADLEKIQGLPGWLSRALGIAPSGRYISGTLRRSVLYRLRQKFSARNARGEALPPELEENLETLALEVADKTEEQILVQVLQIFAAAPGEKNSKSLDSLLGSDSSKKLYREGLHFKQWEKGLADIAEHLILDTSGIEVLNNGKAPPAVVGIPKYSVQVRKAAIGLLNAKTFHQEATSWMKARREKIAADLLARLEPYESISSSAKDLQEWTETEAEVFEAVLETSPRKAKKASEN